MMKLSDIRDWLKTLSVADNYYIGKLDNKKPKSLGVYSRAEKTAESVAIGGYGNTKSNEANVSLLLHWNEKYTDTETAAETLVEAIRTAIQNKTYTIGSHTVDFIRISTDGAVGVGTDENGVYEAVIWLDIVYRD